MSSIKAAIIGCGVIHENHANAIVKYNRAVIDTFCDIKLERALNAAVKYGGKATSDYREVLEDSEINVVHLCTPHYLHTPMAIEALKHGKHVLMEKPAAMNYEEAEKLIKAAQESDRKIGVCFQNRYNNTSRRIKELLDSGKTGRVLGARAFVNWCRDDKYYLYSDWRGKWSTEGGGVLINQAIHTLDLLQWFLGDIESVSGSTAARKLGEIIEVEDTAEAYIKFKSGASALFFGSNCYAANAPVFIEIICENAVIRLEEELSVKWKDGRCEACCEDDLATGEKAYWGLGHSKLINDFYKTIKTNGKFDIDPGEAAKSIKIIDEIRRT